MLTRRIFKENVYARETEAKVLQIKQDDQVLIALDRTVFFPEGGGQSSDIGTIADCTVDYVFEEDDQIWHQVNHFTKLPKEGDTVTAVIDWDHRFDNMQRHCGEHILSGVLHKLYGGVNRGFHMGDDYMTIDISLEDKPEFTKLTWDMVKEAEYQVNRIIWQNLPVVTRHFNSREEAENLPLRKKLNIDRDITIVSVGSIDEPSDCVACCGTHPALTGQVGMIKIYKVEPNKGMFRIYLEAGERAWLQYQHKYDVLTELENRLSANTDDVLQKYSAKDEKLTETKNRLANLSKAVTQMEADKILKQITENSKMIDCEYSILEIQDLMNIGKKVTKEFSGLLVLHHLPSHTLLLFSSTYHCGNIVNESRDKYRVKGGGGKNNARAIFTSEQEAKGYIEYLRNL